MGSLAQYWRDEGKAEGIERGIIKGIEKAAISMRQEGADIEFISKVTELSTLKVQRLKSKL